MSTVEAANRELQQVADLSQEPGNLCMRSARMSDSYPWVEIGNVSHYDAARQYITRECDWMAFLNDRIFTIETMCSSEPDVIHVVKVQTHIAATIVDPRNGADDNE